MILPFCQELNYPRNGTWTKRNKLQLTIFMRSFSSLKIWWKPRYSCITIFLSLSNFHQKNKPSVHSFSSFHVSNFSVAFSEKKYIICYVCKISPRSACLCIKSVKEFKFQLSISGWEKEGWEKAQVHGGVCERVLRRMERFKLISTCFCLHAVLKTSKIS
jgi:hypothetical protein